MIFLQSLQSEWIKKRRSLADWLVWSGSLFIPVIVIFARLTKRVAIPAESAATDFWERHFSFNWQMQALILLPIGVIMATSLVTQLEYRNNTWKQLLTTPQPLNTIFLSKFAVLIAMLLQFFVLFNLGIGLSGVLPNWFAGVDLPQQAVPFGYILRQNGLFFIDCLPVVALQFLLSLQFRNFLAPLGLGVGLLVASLIAVEWRYGYFLPYTYCPYNFFALRGAPMAATQDVNIHFFAMGYFILFMAVSYILFVAKKIKG